MVVMAANTEQLKLNLFENGLDFIQSAIRLVKTNSKNSNIKYAVLHLASGVELILKYRLTQEHWSMIFKEIREAKITALETGNFRSVDFDECVARLENICQISLDGKSANNFKNLKERRNRIMHFDIDESIMSLKALFVKVLNSILDFINKNIDVSKLSDEEKDQISSIRRSFRNFDDFVKKRMNEIKSELNEHNSYSAITLCPLCFQSALVICKEVTGPECLFCGHSGDADSMANEFINDILGISAYETVTGGGEYPLHGCPECGHETLVRGNEAWICFTCGIDWKEGRMQYCETCGTPYSKDEHDIGMCSICISNRIGSD
jgi:hypothetical protein